MSEGLNLKFVDPKKMFPDSLRFMENSLLAFYQALFSTFPKGEFHWDENKEESEIVIEGRSTDNLSDIDTRPKIVAARGSVNWSGRGQGGNNFVGSANLSQFKRNYADINSGVVGISCFSREDMESDRLAQICFDSVQMFAPVLRKLGFLTIHAAQVGNRGMVKSDSRPELFVTPVVIRMDLTRNWSAEKTDPVKLREILLSFRTNP